MINSLGGETKTVIRESMTYGVVTGDNMCA